MTLFCGFSRSCSSNTKRAIEFLFSESPVRSGLRCDICPAVLRSGKPRHPQGTGQLVPGISKPVLAPLRLLSPAISSSSLRSPDSWLMCKGLLSVPVLPGHTVNKCQAWLQTPRGDTGLDVWTISSARWRLLLVGRQSCNTYLL